MCGPSAAIWALQATSDQECLVPAPQSLAIGYRAADRHTDAVTTLRMLMGPLERTGDTVTTIATLRIMREELQRAGDTSFCASLRTTLSGGPCREAGSATRHPAAAS